MVDLRKAKIGDRFVYKESNPKVRNSWHNLRVKIISQHDMVVTHPGDTTFKVGKVLALYPTHNHEGWQLDKEYKFKNLIQDY